MSWETIFAAANIWPLAFWLLLAIGPRSETTARIVFYGGAALLALAYSVLFPLIITGILDPVGPGDGSVNYSDLGQLSGVMALFDSKGGATIGWIHYLAFDLFVGIWVARNADRHGIARWIQVPILFFVLMAGPFGLVLYLLVRMMRSLSPENAATPS